MAHVEHQYEPDEYVPSALRLRPAFQPAVVVYYSFGWERPNGSLVLSMASPSTGLIRALETVPDCNESPFVEADRAVVVRWVDKNHPTILYRWDAEHYLWRKVGT